MRSQHKHGNESASGIAKTYCKRRPEKEMLYLKKYNSKISSRISSAFAYFIHMGRSETVIILVYVLDMSGIICAYVSQCRRCGYLFNATMWWWPNNVVLYRAYQRQSAYVTFGNMRSFMLCVYVYDVGPKEVDARPMMIIIIVSVRVYGRSSYDQDRWCVWRRLCVSDWWLCSCCCRGGVFTYA